MMNDYNFEVRRQAYLDKFSPEAINAYYFNLAISFCLSLFIGTIIVLIGIYIISKFEAYLKERPNLEIFLIFLLAITVFISVSIVADLTIK